MEETARERGEITEMLKACSGGNREAMDKLVPLVYQELHRQAHRYLNRERVHHTLQTTALVLTKDRRRLWNSGFLAV